MGIAHAKRETENVLASPIEAILNRIKIRRQTIIALATGLQRLEGKLSALRNSATPRISNQSRTDHASSSRLHRIEEDIINLKKASDKESVKFAKLGLKSYAESVTWTDLNYHKESVYSGFGYFSDVHVIMAIISIEMGSSVATNPNVDYIKDRADFVKLKLKNKWERYMTTSFDRTIPKLLLSNTKFQIVKDIASYFDTVPLWEQWESTEMGFRTRIIKALANHKRTMEDYLRNILDTNSTLFSVAYQSLLASVSWIEELIRYIDSTYEEYVEAKFRPKKTWNITTRLAMALLYHIAQPRMGIAQALHNTDYEQIKALTVYGIVRSLDAMAQISKDGFRNCYIVSSELVKVLSKNTGYELIDAISTRVHTLETNEQFYVKELSDFKTKFKELGSLFNTLNNKVKDHNTPVKKHKTVIKKIEEKIF